MKPSLDSTEILKKLCGSDDQLLDVVMFVIMIDPSRQIPQLGGEDAIIKRTQSFEETSNALMARINYETLARISFYRSRQDEAKDYLARCEKLSEGQRREMYQFILQNFEKVFHVVKRFYAWTGTKVQ